MDIAFPFLNGYTHSLKLTHGDLPIEATNEVYLTLVIITAQHKTGESTFCISLLTLYMKVWWQRLWLYLF